MGSSRRHTNKFLQFISGSDWERPLRPRMDNAAAADHVKMPSRLRVDKAATRSLINCYVEENENKHD